MKESLLLLSQRERKEVLGKNNSNLWLLTIVVAITFLSISFSNASMHFLSDKMDDPFTNWVDIDYGKMLDKKLVEDLNDFNTQERFKIKNFQTDYVYAFTYFTKEAESGKLDPVKLRGRFMDNLHNELIEAILDPDNIVNGNAITFEEIPNHTTGSFITEEALVNLGYDPKNPPAYILKTELSEGADTLGLPYFEGKYSTLPTPILGVVKRLPAKLDYIASSFFYDNCYKSDVFSLGKPERGRELIYFVNEEEVDNFKNSIHDFIPDSLKQSYKVYPLDDLMGISKPYRKGQFIAIYPFGNRDSESVTPYIDIANRISEKWPMDKAMRTWNFKPDKNAKPSSMDYLSINFERLDQIREFEKYMKNTHGIALDMEQINAKENFNAVSVMANILSWAMIIFSIVCIVLFIVNMLQSYFQKVKRNMGTFKAFGISTSDLLTVFVRMLLGIILFAICIALALSWGIEILMNVLNVLKEGKYSYLELWSVKTAVSACVMVIAAVVTVYVVMNKLMRHTPGDLIYDR